MLSQLESFTLISLLSKLTTASGSGGGVRAEGLLDVRRDGQDPVRFTSVHSFPQ